MACKEQHHNQKLMKWPSLSPDLNPIEHYWSILKRKIYTSGRQYGTSDELWEAIESASKTISSEEIKKLTGSMDNRLFKVIEKKGAWIECHSCPKSYFF